MAAIKSPSSRPTLPSTKFLRELVVHGQTSHPAGSQIQKVILTHPQARQILQKHGVTSAGRVLDDMSSGRKGRLDNPSQYKNLFQAISELVGLHEQEGYSLSGLGKKGPTAVARAWKKTLGPSPAQVKKQAEQKKARILAQGFTADRLAELRKKTVPAPKQETTSINQYGQPAVTSVARLFPEKTSIGQPANAPKPWTTSTTTPLTGGYSPQHGSQPVNEEAALNQPAPAAPPNADQVATESRASQLLPKNKAKKDESDASSVNDGLPL